MVHVSPPLGPPLSPYSQSIVALSIGGRGSQMSIITQCITKLYTCHAACDSESNGLKYHTVFPQLHNPFG